MNFLEAAFDESTAGTAEVDPTGLIVNVNPAFGEALGRQSRDLIGSRLSELFHPEDAGAARRAFDEVAAGRETRHEAEIRYTGHDDGTVVGRTRMSPVRDSTGALAAILVFLEDRTASRATEVALRAEIDGYEELWQAASSAIVILTGAGEVVRIYPGFTRLFGYAPEEAIGRSIHELTGLDDSRDEIDAHIGAALGGQPIYAEVVRRRKDGRRLHVSVLGRRYSHAGAEPRIFLLYRDISDRKEAEALIQRLSTTDDLTGLWNRRGFYTLAAQEVQRAAREKSGLILIYADLDGFKRINDEHGHSEGDRALIALSRILRDSCRASDTIARMGGDEFVILASGVPDGEAILTERIRKSIALLNNRGNRPYSLRLSMGSVYFEPTHENQVADLDGMISVVDRLMYEDKARAIETTA